ncbi:MAG: hypothetical protein JJU00_09330 [Opitutales bacterium]|nr:hypothetical protein [Opitutales bacterium]
MNASPEHRPSLSRRFWLHSALLSGACVAAYAGIRMIPVEPCEFLHYGDFMTADGVIEECGYEETNFFDMDALRFPIIARVTPLIDPEVGVATPMKLTLYSMQGRPIRAENIAVSHTERVHALIVDPSLDDYQHIHPAAEGPAGHYTFTFTPQYAGEHQVYLDFILLTTNRRALVSTTFEVPGDETAEPRALSGRFEEDGLVYTLGAEDGSLRAGKDAVIRLRVDPADGKHVEFEPVMGSFAHLVAFQRGRHGFAHLHPRNPFLRDHDPLDPDLSFSIHLDQPGDYRVWAQVKINGRERIVPFDLKVRG